MEQQPKNKKFLNTDGEIPVLRWSNRRRMAWWSFICLVVGTLLFWFGLPLWFLLWGIQTSWMEIIGASFSWFAMAMTGVIGAYMGFNSVSSMKNPIVPMKSNNMYGGNQSIQPAEVDYDNNDVDEDYYDPSKLK